MASGLTKLAPVVTAPPDLDAACGYFEWVLDVPAVPSGRLGSADRSLVCTREPLPDAFGEPVAADRDRGAPQLPRTTE